MTKYGVRGASGTLHIMKGDTNREDVMFLELMANTSGDAKIDVHGVMVPSGEYVAALYESYAADTQDYDVSRTPEAYENNVSMNAYANTAARLAEDLWTRDVESLII